MTHTQIDSSIEKCDHCHKFFDPKNNNFFLNLAISKFKKENKVNPNLLDKIQENVNNTSKIDWCTCYTHEKIQLEEIANNHFNDTFNTQPISEITNIKDIGLDFTINKNIIYIENNNFAESDFLKYNKSLKVSLNNSIFEYDFLTYDKINDESFSKSFRKYYLNPNFLLITELHKLKENQLEELKNIVSIIKERLSNNKITFILINQDFPSFKKTIKMNNWAKNELIYTELFNILSGKFCEKLITTSLSNSEEIVIKTLDYKIAKPKSKATSTKKKAAKPKEDFDNFD